jgi:hypothetical protein
LFDTRAFYWDAAGAVTSLGHRFPLHCLAVILAILTKIALLAKKNTK